MITRPVGHLALHAVVVALVWTHNVVHALGNSAELCAAAVPNVTAGKLCAPAVTVLGMPKSASSALMYFLREHPRLRLLHNQKEACPPMRGDLPDVLRFLQVDPDLEAVPLPPGPKPSSTADMYINGCINLFRAVPWCAEGLELSDGCRPVPFYATYLKTVAAVWSEARYILLLRDLPTLVPGQYNFWCFKDLDGPANCTHRGQWHDPALHRKRTPEDLEELVVRGGREKLARFLNFAAVSYKRLVLGLEALVGRERLMIVSQQQLLRNTSAVMEQVFNYIGLPHAEGRSFGSIVNAGSEKGPYRIGSVKQPGSYFQVTPATRQELLNWFREDCEWLRDERGVHLASEC